MQIWEDFESLTAGRVGVKEGVQIIAWPLPWSRPQSTLSDQESGDVCGWTGTGRLGRV